MSSASTTRAARDSGKATGTAPQDDADLALLTESEVATLTRLSRKVRDQLTRTGRFPAPLLLGHRTKRYRRQHILEWLEEQAEIGRHRYQQGALRADFLATVARRDRHGAV